MKPFQSFDEMIKYKLHKKEYPFNEAHWNEMEKLLDSAQAAPPDMPAKSRPFRTGLLAGLVAGLFFSGFAVGAYFYHQSRCLSPLTSVADKQALTNTAISQPGYDSSLPVSKVTSPPSIQEDEKISDAAISSSTLAYTENSEAVQIHSVPDKIVSAAPAQGPLAKDLILVDHSASHKTPGSSGHMTMDSHTTTKPKAAAHLPATLSLPSAEKINGQEGEAREMPHSADHPAATQLPIQIENLPTNVAAAQAETAYLEDPTPVRDQLAYPAIEEISPVSDENTPHIVAQQTSEDATPSSTVTPSAADENLPNPATKEPATGSNKQKAKDRHQLPQKHHKNGHFYHQLGLSYLPLFTQLSSADNKSLSQGVAAGYHFGFKKRFELQSGLEYFYTQYQSLTFFNVVNAGSEPLESFYHQQKLGIPLMIKIKPAKNKVLSPYFATGAIAQMRISSHYQNLVNKIQVQEDTENVPYPEPIAPNNTDVQISRMESSANKDFSFSAQAEAGIVFRIGHHICINAGWLYRRELSGDTYFQKSNALDNAGYMQPWILEVKKAPFSYSGIDLGLSWKLSK